MSDKTHYRKVFKSDHLGVADIEDLIESGTRLVFTIAHVKQEYDVAVAGRKGNYNIAYFREPIKPLVLNATNSKIMKKFCGGSSFVEDWKEVTIELYIDPSAKLKGEIVGGVRISPNPPQMQKRELTPDNSKQWENAIAAFKRDGSLDAVLSRVIISEANQNAIIEAANALPQH
ncbi:hypothetical protein [uncultured Paraglaciecola sp.]|uniref:hypothetical protein n=1 Tax=uncultured Paraglaciecola sp. TaxID=1765024 RepID=UPI00261D1AC2|nr:hypothetical protein [uncultured Paraglaciecola sp.]